MPFEATSESRAFRLRVQPIDFRTARITVTPRSGKKTGRAWDRKLPFFPVEAFVSNTGQVVTLDEWGTVGRGTNVIALYDSHSRVAGYSLDDLFKSMGGNARTNIVSIPMTVSSTWWRGHEGAFALFYPLESPEFFCLWLNWHTNWVALRLSDGALQELAPETLNGLNKTAISRCVTQLSAARAETFEKDAPAINFLTAMTRDELPSYDLFSKSRIFQVHTMIQGGRSTTYAFSPSRSAMEKSLAASKGIVIGNRAGEFQGFRQGTIRATIQTVPMKTVAILRVFAMRSGITEISKAEGGVSLWLTSKDSSLNFQFQNLPPGRYRLKAYLDQRESQGDVYSYRPRPGVYESDLEDSPEFEVKAGEATPFGTIRCDREIGKKR